MATLVLLRLAALTGDARYGDAAERALATVTSFLGRFPTGFANWLSAAELAVGGIVELAIAGEPTATDTQALLATATAGGRRDLVVAVAADPASSVVPLLADRVSTDGRATAYVCRQFTCRLPVTEPSALADQLAEAASAAT